MRHRRMRGPCNDPLHDQSGQSTTEYAIVFTIFLGMLVALGLVWQAGHQGAFVDAAEGTASHRVVVGLPETAESVQDIFMF